MLNFSFFLGVLNYELHLPIFLRAQVKMSMGIIDASEALPAFKESLDCLKKSLEHMRFEREGSFGFDLKNGAEQAHGQLKAFIQQLES